MAAIPTQYFPKHLNNLLSNLKETHRLLDIHKEVSGTGPGYRHNVQVLNKSAVVLLVATWEAYIEDLAEGSFSHLVGHSNEPDNIPNKVLTLASKDIRKSQDHRAIWKLAGTGWKTILREHMSAVIKEKIGTLHTPRPKQIDDLFSSLIGISNLSKCWYWQGMSNSNATEKLNQLITLRGDIAHRVETTEQIKKQYVKDCGLTIIRMSVISNNKCRAHLHKITGTYPWHHEKYGSVS